MTSKVWEVMNDLEMVTSKIVSAREIIDTAAEAIQKHDYNKAETLAMAAYEFLGYYLDEFDAKFKLAWQETVVKQKQEETNAWDAVNKERKYYEGWEENYYPEEYKQYTEEEMNAMCDKAASDQEKEKCREYNLREAEYYDKRAKLDGEYNLKKELEFIRDAGGYEWTPDPEVSRNDSNRLKVEEGWVYESSDGGKTVTKRKPKSLEKIVVKADGYSTTEENK